MRSENEFLALIHPYYSVHRDAHAFSNLDSDADPLVQIKEGLQQTRGENWEKPYRVVCEQRDRLLELVESSQGTKVLVMRPFDVDLQPQHFHLGLERELYELLQQNRPSGDVNFFPKLDRNIDTWEADAGQHDMSSTRIYSKLLRNRLFDLMEKWSLDEKTKILTAGEWTNHCVQTYTRTIHFNLERLMGTALQHKPTVLGKYVVGKEYELHKSKEEVEDILSHSKDDFHVEWELTA